jgi:hypothetical protein
MHNLSLALLAATMLFAGAVRAQSFCSSDGVPRPTALLERFVNADCADCWTDRQTPDAAAGTVAVDWVLPGSRGEEAPLSAVATRDALHRLEATRRPPPSMSSTAFYSAGSAPALRVGHGLPFNDYIGTTIEWRPSAGKGPWTAWLLLVETLPRGAEGSAVERNLVRNALRVEWTGAGTARLRESRPMRIPEGAKVERLRVVGWTEDARGQVLSLAQSRCAGSR